MQHRLMKEIPKRDGSWDVEKFVTLLEDFLVSDGRMVEMKTGKVLRKAWFVEISADTLKVEKVLMTGGGGKKGRKKRK